MNIKEYELKSLNEKDLNNTNGGIIWFIAGVIISVGLCCLDDPESFAQGYRDGHG
jgi:hypothetical protein